MKRFELCGNTIGAVGENAVFAAKLLARELERRTGLSFAVGETGAIVIREDPAAAPAPEGYTLTAADGSAVLTGFDRRGCIYAAGRLLRECFWRSGGLELPEMEISTYPKKPLRGAQVGYRNKTNAYSAWDMETYDRYLTDLMLFGANSVEFLPGRTDDADSSPCMKYNSHEMLCHTSRFAHELGLDVWIWYPNMIVNKSGRPLPEKGFLDETDDAARELNRMLREEDARREHDFATVPHIDHIMIPGGDPGDLEPEDLFAFSGRVAAILHKYHPKAGVWVSAQVMKNDESFKFRFYDQVVKKPAWLTGVVHAPWVSHVMSECRRRTPVELPIRNYADICHGLCCEYPYHALDPVWAVTVGREAYNPRPRWHRRMQELNAPYNIGSLTYSEGIADDVSKMIWFDGEWDAGIPAVKTLRDFASMFISPAHADELASLLAGFEDIFEGPAVSNTAVGQVYAGLRAVEKAMKREGAQPGFGADSYRFAMPMLASAFCLLTQKRAVRDGAIYAKAMDEQDAGGTAAEIAARMRADLAALDEPADRALYDEVWALADVCWDKIRWKVDERRHQSPAYDRGGFVETIDLPLCNSVWMKAKLEQMEALSGEEERLAAIRALRDRGNAGPGGKYISFGTPDSMRYLELDKSWWDEPEAITVPRIEQYVGIWGPDRLGVEDRDKVVLERVSSVLGYYNARVKVCVDGLVPGAPYELRVVFPLRFGRKGKSGYELFILCEGKRLVHTGNVPGDEWVYCYDVPAGCVDAAGRLRLTFDKATGPRGSGVTELWLIRRG
ncbi:MAG: hypothetical protein IJL69_04965 [Oscillospiraceae bacterium]|nr:hypothetical protein [Oscillospiraceae bacterium]